MRRGTASLVWLFALLLVSAPARGGQRVFADFDGDGHRDRAAFDAAQGTAICIWLSSRQSVSILHVSEPILRFVAFDVDGDGRPELVTADGASGLHVWTAGGGTVRPYRPARRFPGASRAPGRPVAADDDPVEPIDSLPPHLASPVWLATSAVCFVQPSSCCRDGHAYPLRRLREPALGASAPRPPPPVG